MIFFSQTSNKNGFIRGGTLLFLLLTRAAVKESAVNTKTRENNSQSAVFPPCRLVLKQLVSGYTDELSLLAPSISGFRRGHSTVNALLGLRDDLLRAMKKGEVSLMVFADYSKAFDIVCFKTVLTKMHALGF